MCITVCNYFFSTLFCIWYALKKKKGKSSKLSKLCREGYMYIKKSMFRIRPRGQEENSVSQGLALAWQRQWKLEGGPEHKVNPGKIKPGLLSQLPLTSPLMELHMVRAKNVMQAPSIWVRGNYHLGSFLSFQLPLPLQLQKKQKR